MIFIPKTPLSNQTTTTTTKKPNPEKIPLLAFPVIARTEYIFKDEIVATWQNYTLEVTLQF